MGRSLSFASTAYDSRRPVRTRFRFGSSAEQINLAIDGNSPVHYAKGTRSSRTEQAQCTGLPLLVGTWFQVLLTPLIGVLFTFQSPYFTLSVVE